ARPGEEVKLLHGSDHVVNVLDDVNRRHPVETVIAEGIRCAVEIAQDVGPARWIAVDADRARLFVDAAADVERSYVSWIVIFRHSSSTSTAKAAWSRVITSGGHSRMEFSPAPST